MICVCLFVAQVAPLDSEVLYGTTAVGDPQFYLADFDKCKQDTAGPRFWAFLEQAMIAFPVTDKDFVTGFEEAFDMMPEPAQERYQAYQRWRAKQASRTVEPLQQSARTDGKPFRLSGWGKASQTRALLAAMQRTHPDVDIPFIEDYIADKTVVTTSEIHRAWLQQNAGSP